MQTIIVTKMVVKNLNFDILAALEIRTKKLRAKVALKSDSWDHTSELGPHLKVGGQVVDFDYAY